MAVTYRFPTLIWQDHQGFYTAVLLDRDAPAGFARNASTAREQVEDYLQYLYQKYEWLDPPDFLEARLATFKVPVRPEYTAQGRRFPCEETVSLLVHAVHGRQEHGMFVCALPTLDLRFYYYEADALKGLVSHYVQQRLEGMTPAELGSFLPPVRTSLEDIVLTVKSRRRSSTRWEVEMPSLKSVAEPLGESTTRKQFSRPWERDQQVNDLVQRLGKEKANVLLVGEPGCGKTTVLVEAIRLLERSGTSLELFEEDLQSRPKRRYWSTSAARLIAGMKYLGQWEERCEEIISELDRIGGVLCVENLLDLLREGGEGPTNSLAAFFLPYLQRGEMRLVAEVTPAELDACRRLLPGFADVFQLLHLPEFSNQEAIKVLGHLTHALEQNHHVEVARGVTHLTYHLFRRFLPYQAFPGRASVFLADLFERARQERRRRVDTEQVIQQLVQLTGLPELFLRDEIPLVQEEVRNTFRRQVIGQEEACEVASHLVTTFKAGLNDPGRPVGVYLFCGPTGVGKTELARTLARYFFGHSDEKNPRSRLVRLDMSEYAGYGAARRLLQQPDGQPSELIQQLRQQPFVVLLLDEIEKADPEVFDIFLSVCDEGRLSDRYGRVTTFRSTIIVMTSNLGAGKTESFGFGSRPEVQYEGEAMEFFRPEFFNRLDGVVTFQPLSQEVVQQITRKELMEMAEREGLVRAGVLLDFSDPLVEFLARQGFDPRYGARPLQRTLEDRVVTPLAHFLLEHPDLRDAIVKVDVDEGGEIHLRMEG
jgi:ATP-dependent Clp protease ATP-binding subunit ClpC